MTSTSEISSDAAVMEQPRETLADRVAPEQGTLESSLWSMFCAYYTRARDHRDLADLDDGALKDIGLTREQIRKPFWDPWGSIR